MCVPQVGYVQGMNFLAGYLLIVNGGNEELAFELFVMIMQVCSYPPLHFYMSHVYSEMCTFSHSGAVISETGMWTQEHVYECVVSTSTTWNVVLLVRFLDLPANPCTCR